MADLTTGIHYNVSGALNMHSLEMQFPVPHGIVVLELMKTAVTAVTVVHEL